MRFIICGTLLPPEVEQILPGASPAAGKYLRNMERALQRKGIEVIEMSYVAIPGAKEAFEKAGKSDEDITYKDNTIIRSIKDYQKKVIKTLQKDDVVVFYNVVYFDLGLINKIKRRGNKAVLILADFTDSLSESGNYKRWAVSRFIAREFKKFDYGIALSERAKRFFSPKAKLIVMEGGINYSDYEDYKPPIKSDVIRFMYAGTLSYVTGIDTLLDAISMVSADNVEFYISGKGELDQRVSEEAKKDKRIKYLGFVSDKQYYTLLNDVDVLINPRNMTLLQNQNNFPSKVLEYLATGREVISTKFPGWERFADNFRFYEGGAEVLKTEINKSLSDDLALRYVINRSKAEGFDWNKQINRVIELIS